MEGALHGFADTAGQVDVCRIDDDPFCILIDRDNAVERMLALFGILLMTRQTNNLFFLLASKGASQLDDPGRQLIVDAPAGRTKRFVRVLGSHPPLPTSLVIDCPALWTDCAVIELLLTLIRIKDVIFLGMSSDPATGGGPARV